MKIILTGMESGGMGMTEWGNRNECLDEQESVK